MLRPVEPRANPEDPTVPVSAADFLQFFGLGEGGLSAAGIAVTTEKALGVPAVWCAVNFMAGELASLPLHVYRRRGENRERDTGGLAILLADAVNDETTSFRWRKALFDQVFTEGRSVTFIERNPTARIVNLWPLEPRAVTIKRRNGRREYHYRDGRRTVVYRADEVIDLAFAEKPDMLGHYSPLQTCRDAIGRAIALTQYGSKFFQGGGVPPFAVTGNFQSVAGMKRGADDLQDAVRKAAKEQRLALVMPQGLEIKPIGADPEKSQMVEAHRFTIEEVARIYSLPPVFLQDLTHGTFSNTEQQDLHFVKHTLLRWTKQFEQELNLKLFGRTSNSRYVEMNVDGLLRGDFKTRMDGYAAGIQHGILMPNEARRRENLPEQPEGDRLLIQGAMVPLDPELAPAPAVPPAQDAPDPAAALAEAQDPQGDPTNA